MFFRRCKVCGKYFLAKSQLLISGIMDNVNGLFDNVNSRVAGIAGQVGATPQGWNSGVYGMIRTLSDNVILPIAGVVLAFVMTLELIQLITEKNNMHDVDTWMFFKWIFKTACAVLIVTNTWNIVMGVFEAAQSVVNSASGIIISDTSLTFNEHIAGFEAKLLDMEVWSLLGLWLESVVVHLSMWDGLGFWLFADIFNSQKSHIYSVICNTDPLPCPQEKGYRYPMETGDIRYQVFSSAPTETRQYEQQVVSVMTTQAQAKLCRTCIHTLSTDSQTPQTSQVFFECFTFAGSEAKVCCQQGMLHLEWNGNVYKLTVGEYDAGVGRSPVRLRVTRDGAETAEYSL